MLMRIVVRKKKTPRFEVPRFDVWNFFHHLYFSMFLWIIGSCIGRRSYRQGNSSIIIAVAQFHFLSFFSERERVPYHFLQILGREKVQHPFAKFLAWLHTRFGFCLHISSLIFWVPSMTFIIVWTFPSSCIVVCPGKIFHSNTTSSPAMSKSLRNVSYLRRDEIRNSFSLLNVS